MNKNIEKKNSDHDARKSGFPDLKTKRLWLAEHTDYSKKVVFPCTVCHELGTEVTSYGEIRKYIIEMKAENFPCGEISISVNVRNDLNKTLKSLSTVKLYKEVYGSLTSNHGDFGSKNNGCDIMIDGGRFEFDENEGKIQIQFGNNEKTNGLINGAHTAEIINVAKNNKICIDKQNLMVRIFVLVFNEGLQESEKQKYAAEFTIAKNSVAELAIADKMRAKGTVNTLKFDSITEDLIAGCDDARDHFYSRLSIAKLYYKIVSKVGIDGFIVNGLVNGQLSQGKTLEWIDKMDNNSTIEHDDDILNEMHKYIKLYEMLCYAEYDQGKLANKLIKTNKNKKFYMELIRKKSSMQHHDQYSEGLFCLFVDPKNSLSHDMLNEANYLRFHDYIYEKCKKQMCSKKYGGIPKAFTLPGIWEDIQKAAEEFFAL